MAIEIAFQRLAAAFAETRDVLQSLSLTIIEDRPLHDEVLLVERLGNLVEDLRGWTEEGCAAAVKAREAVAYPPDFNAARHALGVAHERSLLVQHKLLAEAASHETLDALLRFGRDRGREWLGWSRSAQQALEGCRAPVRSVGEALLQAWAELAERLSVRSVSVQATSIGQQVSASHLKGREAARQTKDVFT